MDRYEEALERAKKGLPIDEVFPELKESEDERIRKELLEEIEFIIPHDDETDSEGLILPSYHARIDRYKSYLEKQKEQKPAEWSEEDERKIIELKTFIAQCNGFNKKNRKKVFDMIDTLRPQPHWKPSDEQMKALSTAYRLGKLGKTDMESLQSLYEQLKKL